tara:strand:- start:271 stop:1500 length:1230 start_codon:yes stop_codon:yes gene_type:complete
MFSFHDSTMIKNSFIILLSLMLLTLVMACKDSHPEMVNITTAVTPNVEIIPSDDTKLMSLTVTPSIVINDQTKNVAEPTDTVTPDQKKAHKIPEQSPTPTITTQETEVDILSEWICIDISNIPWVDDLSTTDQDDLRCKMDIEYTDLSIILKSNGIPNHDFQSGIGCCASEQDYTWTLPRYPRIANEVTMAPDRGPIAITVTGIPIYGPEEGPGGDAVALHHDYFIEDRQPIELGLCGGHSGPGGTYHYHFDANCIHWHPEENSGEKWSDWIIDKIDKTIHSPILGYAFDGFPIYGMYGWDDNGFVTMMTSSYQLKSGANGYGGIDDWEYIAGLGTLDECNGRSGPVPEYPEGIYHYHSTLFNGGNLIGFPYFLLCYKGTPDETNFSQRQGNGVGQGTQQRRPSPRRQQ